MKEILNWFGNIVLKSWGILGIILFIFGWIFLLFEMINPEGFFATNLGMGVILRLMLIFSYISITGGTLYAIDFRCYLRKWPWEV